MNIPAKIRWRVSSGQEDEAGDGHVTMHYAIGQSEDGRIFTGTAIKCDGEVVSVQDIEEDV